MFGKPLDPYEGPCLQCKQRVKREEDGVLYTTVSLEKGGTGDYCPQSGNDLHYPVTHECPVCGTKVDGPDQHCEGCAEDVARVEKTWSDWGSVR